MTLRGEADWPLWRAARLAALADSPAAFPRATVEWADGGEDRWRERLLDASALSVVAVVDATPAGLVRGAIAEQAAWLHSLWVSPNCRGHGLGGRLIAAVEDWARPRAARVRLEVVPSNESAIALYERHEYVVTEEFGERLADGGHELVMEKLLG